jgi:peptidoglycan/LPS O-acetylase OafA/YrhL
MVKAKQIDSLTGLRGIAAVYVLLYHYFEGQKMTNPITTFLAHGYLSVDIFFVLSGFVMALNYGKIFRLKITISSFLWFLGRRLARVYPLYIAATLLACIVLRLIPIIFFTKSLWLLLVQNVLMIQNWSFGASLDPPAWSISAEWAAYLLFPWLLIPTLFRSKSMAIVCCLLSIALLTLLSFLPASMVFNPTPNKILNIYSSWFSLCRCLPEFSLGILAYRASKNPNISCFMREHKLTTSLCLLSLLLLAFPSTDLAFIFTIPISLVALANGDYSPQRFLASRPMLILGNLSYSIYLLHMLPRLFIDWVDSQARLHGLAHPHSYAALAGAVVTIPLVWLAHRFIELPGQKYLRKLFETTKPYGVEQIASLEQGMP